MPETDELLTLTEVAARLHTSKRTVLRLIETRALHAIDIGLTKRVYWRVKASEVDAFIARRVEVSP